MNHDELRAKVIQQTLRQPPAPTEEKREAALGEPREINSSDLATAVKKQGGLGLLEQVLQKKSGPDKEAMERDALRRKVIDSTLGGGMLKEAADQTHSNMEDPTFRPMPEQEVNKLKDDLKGKLPDRQTMIEQLADDDVDSLYSDQKYMEEWLREVLIKGLKGFEEWSDEDIQQAYLDRFEGRM